MAHYRISGQVDGSNIKTITKKATDVFGDCVKVEKIEPATSRASRLSEAQAQIEDAKIMVEELKDEMEQWRDGIPENLQGGQKYEEVEACEDALSSLLDSLNDLDFDSIEFPGMF